MFSTAKQRGVLYSSSLYWSQNIQGSQCLCFSLAVESHSDFFFPVNYLCNYLTGECIRKILILYF